MISKNGYNSKVRKLTAKEKRDFFEKKRFWGHNYIRFSTSANSVCLYFREEVVTF